MQGTGACSAVRPPARSAVPGLVSPTGAAASAVDAARPVRARACVCVCVGGSVPTAVVVTLCVRCVPHSRS